MKKRKFFSAILIVFIFTIFDLSGCGTKQHTNPENEIKEYVVNKRTRKIHTSTCSSVDKMSKKNKLFVSDTLINLLSQDYVICRNCRAGIAKPQADEMLRRLFHGNLYGDEIKISASCEDYLEAINETGEWYVNHVPTYAAIIQGEPYSRYDGNLKNYKEYDLKNKRKTSAYRVLTSDLNARSTLTLKPDDQILRGTENAAANYKDYFGQIDFDRKIAYYPCDFLSRKSDYYKPGDDCVRFLFAVFNRMDSQFTKKYALLTKSNYSRTSSKMIATDNMDVAYGFINLGFKIYDSTPQEIDVDDDGIAEGLIFDIDSNFQLQKGDILAREGHVHIYLGEGAATEAANFGWGRVYRSFPQFYEIKTAHHNGMNYISLTNADRSKEYYRRVYRYLGTTGGSE